MPTKLTQTQFIEKATAKHGGIYDYSRSIYINNNTQIIINCLKHGAFTQRPTHHLIGKGCRICGQESSRLAKILTITKFIHRANIVHGKWYDYSQVIYNTTYDKVKIICPVHGIFEQLPNYHLSGRGCALCGVAKRTRSKSLSTKQFIDKANAVHRMRYDYSQINYINSKLKVKIICPVHGIFEKALSDHTSLRQGCPECSKVATARARSLGLSRFLIRARLIHGEKYEYSHVSYRSALINVEIICPEHGLFQQIPATHLSGSGCPHCGVKRTANCRADSASKSFLQRAFAIHG